MITKVHIKDNTKTPLCWLHKLPNFENGTEYDFKNGVNVIIGENGSGKSTLLDLIKSYLLVDYSECSIGKYRSNLDRIVDYGKGMKDGADIYADYKRNTFRLCHCGERCGEDALDNFEVAQTIFNQKSSSTGEGVLIAIDSLFKMMFSKKAKLFFDYDQFKDTSYNDYYQYIEKHRVDCENSWTILMDEPDRNLSIDNIDQIISILSYKKPNTQIIAVVHNPLIIYSLSKIDDRVNFIEMTKGYRDSIIDKINDLVL